MSKRETCTQLLARLKSQTDMNEELLNYVNNESSSRKDVMTIMTFLIKKNIDLDRIEILKKILDYHTLEQSDIDNIIDTILSTVYEHNNNYDIICLCDYFIDILIMKGYTFGNRYMHDMMRCGISSIYNMYVKKASGTIEELNNICRYYLSCYDHHYSTARKLSFSKKYYLAASEIFSNKTISEEIMISILRHNIIIGCPNCSFFSETSNKFYYHNVYNVVTVDLYEKFKNDYYQLFNKKYVMSHKMMLMLMLNIDVKCIVDDIMMYFQDVDFAMDFFVSNFGTCYIKTSYYGFKTYMETVIYDVENDRIDGYSIDVNVFKNIVYVAQHGIMKRVKNYKMLFRLFFGRSRIDKNVYDNGIFDYHHEFLDVGSYHMVVNASIDNVLGSVSNMNDTEAIYFHNLCVVRMCFLKIMFDMVDELELSGDDIEYASRMCDSVAMSIILKRVSVTERSVMYLCKQTKVSFSLKILKDLFDNKLMPKFEYIENVLFDPCDECEELIECFIENGMDVTKDVIQYCMYNRIYIKNYETYVMQYEDVIYDTFQNLCAKHDKNVRSNFNTHARRYEKFASRLLMRCRKTVSLSSYISESEFPKSEIIKYCLYNNKKIDKRVYDNVVKRNIIDAIDYCEKHQGYSPNEDTMMYIDNAYVRRAYMRRIIEGITK